MKLLLLSKDNIDLAKGEAEAVLGKGKLIDNALFIKTNKKTARLAYTRMIIDVLFEANNSNIEQKIRRFNWNMAVRGSFALFFLEDHDMISQSLSREYGGMIYDILRGPKVDLENPKTKIIALKIKNKVYFGVEEWENKEKFFERRPSIRPGQQPITLQPRLARACVNLTDSKTSVYDPFCGVGGFLIEAGLMKLRVIGSDYSNKMIDLCRKNLKFYKINKFKLFQEDALRINKKYDYIVTDPPYGKGSKIIGNDFYARFIVKLGKILKKRAIVIFPDFIDARKLIKKTDLKIKNHFSIYIHKSLTRNIYVLEK